MPHSCVCACVCVCVALASYTQLAGRNNTFFVHGTNQYRETRNAIFVCACMCVCVCVCVCVTLAFYTQLAGRNNLIFVRENTSASIVRFKNAIFVCVCVCVCVRERVCEQMSSVRVFLMGTVALYRICSTGLR